MSQVTFTIAVLAVVAAIAASLETTESDKAIVAKNDAVLAQDQATDAWGLANSKSLRKKVYELAADTAGGAKAATDLGAAAKEGADETKAQDVAKGFERQRDAALARSDVFEARHGRLTISSTLLHMAIAIATLSILLKKRWPWLTALALTAVGFAAGAWAFFGGV